MKARKEKRLRVIYSGNVQGVGFRFTVKNLGSYLGVKGFVRNLPDGTVEVVCEGDEKPLTEFTRRIEDRMAGYIKGRSQEESPSTGEFISFEVRS